jgi:hypothetical protein
LTCQDKKKKKQNGQALGRLPSNRPTSLPLCHDWTWVIVVSPPFTVINSGGERQKKKGEILRGTREIEGRNRGEKGEKKTKQRETL